MLLANCIDTSSVQSFHLVTIGCLQRGKGPDVTGLELVGGVGRDATQGDVVFKTELQDLKGFVCPEAIAYQYAWFLIRQFSSLRVEHELEPLCCS